MTYLKLLDSEYKMLKETEKITSIDYEIGDFIKVENLMSIIEDLKIEYDRLDEEFKDYKQNIEDNYKQIKLEEQI